MRNQARDWIISSASSGGDNCVAVKLREGTVAVRHSRHPEGLHVLFSDREWSAFLAAIRNGSLAARSSNAENEWFITGPADQPCVAVRFFDDAVALRHSRDPESQYLTFTFGEWDAFRAGVQNGEFDRPQPDLGFDVTDASTAPALNGPGISQAVSERPPMMSSHTQR